MKLEEKEILYKDLSYKITGLAIKVYNELGYGFLEKVYKNALMVLFNQEGIKAQQQKSIPVYFREQIIGEYFADILIEDKIVLEIRTGEGLSSAHYAQLLNYLKATSLRLGILINVGPNRLTYKRIVK